jgi:hypothetical protein
MSLGAIAELKPDPRIRRVHYDWLDAGEHTQRTVSDLSKQLRRFLDDQAWLENRRIMDIIHGIETHALTLRKSPPAGSVMTITDTAASIELSLERPLFMPALKPQIEDLLPEPGEEEIDASVLFSQIVIDKPRLVGQIRRMLHAHSQVTLRELCDVYPLQHGLAELITYLQLSSDGFKSVVDENSVDVIVWHSTVNGERRMKHARLPRVLFVR